VKLVSVLDNISDHWPANTPPNPQHLRIIVELPSGKRCVHWVSEISLTVSVVLNFASTSPWQAISCCRRPDDRPPRLHLPWLEEVHSKIWNHKDLKPTLFRKVEVTQAHYAAFQERLKELHLNRDSPDYDGTKPDVLSVKLDFLRSLTPAEVLSPRHPDGNDDRVDDDDDSEASNEDDPEIKSLFPSILSFLDLSTLKLKENVPNRLPSPLLLRQEYKDFSELIEKEPQNSGGSVIVSGQPGIGEFLVSLSHRI
jgi:hypothetical protein